MVTPAGAGIVVSPNELPYTDKAGDLLETQATEWENKLDFAPGGRVRNFFPVDDESVPLCRFQEVPGVVTEVSRDSTATVPVIVGNSRADQVAVLA